MTDYLVLLGNDHCRAFLSLIRRCEGANYNTLFGGGAFSGWADHPRQRVTRQSGGRPLTSTAAGAYQFLARTWDDCRAATGLPDFSPASQDIAALWLIDRREALADVIAGDWLAAIGKCNKEWASLPGSPYGQPTRSMAYCLEHLRRSLAPLPAPGGSLPVVRGSNHDPRSTIHGFSNHEPPTTNPGLVSRLFTLPDFLQALRAGQELAHPETWKRASVWTGSLTALLGAATAIARAYGYSIPLGDAEIATLVSAAAVVVGLFQSWSTMATTRRIGLPPGPDAVGAGAADPAGPRVVARPAALPRGPADAGGDLPVLTDRDPARFFPGG